MRTARPARTHRAIFRWLALGISLGISLAFAEGVARLLVHPYLRPGKRVDLPYPAWKSDYLPFTLAPDHHFEHVTPTFSQTYTTNHWGLRDDELVPIPRPPEERRILICGDSFALGWGVAFSQTMGEVLETRLIEQGQSPARVLNAGYRAGYTLSHYHAFLKREADELEATDLIVLIFSGNDRTDLAEDCWPETDAAGLPLRITSTRAFVGPEGRLVDESGYDPWLPIGLRELRVAAWVARLSRPRPLTPIGNRRADEEWSRLIHGIAAYARQRRISLTWVILSPRQRTAESDRTEALCRSVFDPQAGSAGQTALGKILWAESIATEAGDERLDWFLPGDAHYNALGHRRIADALANILTEDRP